MIGLGNLTTPATPFAPSGNPIWDEIQNAHSTLSPAAQRAVALSGVPQRAAEGDAAPIASPTPEAPMAAPRPIASPSALSIRGLGKPSATPTTSEASAHLGELNRVTAPPLPDQIPRIGAEGQFERMQANPLAHTSADTGRAGIGQIHNKFVRGLARVGDAVGSAFLPNLTAMIPGTELHHREVVDENQGIVNADVARAKTGAETDEAEARSGSLLHPSKQWKQSTEPETDPDHPELGPQAVWYNESDPTQKHFGGAPVAAKPTGVKSPLDLFLRDNPKGTAEDWAAYQEKHRPITNEFESWLKDPANKGKTVEDFMKLKAANSTPKEGEMPLGERVPNINAALLNRFKVLNPTAAALPPEYALPPNATQKDFDRVDKLLESTERASGTKAQQDSAAEARRQTQELAKANRQQHTDTAVRSAAFKAYTPAMDSAERFNVMAKNYEDAVSNHDQQAMLSLLANHLGMTMGLQKGARLTKDIIHEAEASRPWLQGLAAKFDSNGYLAGVTLTPEQMRQMVNLGRERFSEDVVKGRSEAHYQGANDEGPERIPNKSTINHYTALAGGDSNKAKELARNDGWTVK